SRKVCGATRGWSRKRNPPRKQVVRSVGINITNKSDGKMTYEYRWDDEKQFKRLVLERGKEFTHTKRLPAKGDKAPVLVVKVEGYKNLAKLHGRLFAGDKPKAFQVTTYIFGMRLRGIGASPFTDPEPPGIGEDDDD